MNLNIVQCKNGWLVTKHEDVTNGLYTLPVTGSIQHYKVPDQFVFSNMEEFFEWFKTNFVLEKLTK